MRITPELVISAFRACGRRPGRGDFHGVAGRVCALTAILMCLKGGKKVDTRDVERLFCLTQDSEFFQYLTAFMCGFDGYEPEGWYTERELEGHVDGIAVWKGLVEEGMVEEDGYGRGLGK